MFFEWLIWAGVSSLVSKKRCVNLEKLREGKKNREIRINKNQPIKRKEMKTFDEIYQECLSLELSKKVDDYKEDG